MRKSEHILRLSFDPEYQEKYSAWKSILRMYIEIEIEYLTTPMRYVKHLIWMIAACIFVSAALSAGRFWWLGIPAGIALWFLISLHVTAYLLWEERRKLGLELVWPW